MICKWKARNPLTLEDRIKIKRCIDLNLSYNEMGMYIGRCKSVVMKECKRLGHFTNYDPYKAQEDFEAKQKLIGIKKDTNG